MCRVLVRWTEKPRQLACLEDWKYEATRSRRGDPIVAMDDGHVWGREEGLPNYVSIDIPGLPKEQIRKYIKSEDSFIATPNGSNYPINKRAYNIRIDMLPSDIINKLSSDGYVTITLSSIRGKIQRKLTGVLE